MGHTMSAQKPPPQLARFGVAVGRRAILVVPEGLEAPSTRTAPWRDITRPTLDEMYYDAMKAPAPAFSARLGFDTMTGLRS
jgi:hypothetical protein